MKEEVLRRKLLKIDKENKGVVTILQLKDILAEKGFNYPKDALDRIFKDVIQIQLPEN